MQKYNKKWLSSVFFGALELAAALVITVFFMWCMYLWVMGCGEEYLDYHGQTHQMKC
jgi:hypothetical protein